MPSKSFQEALAASQSRERCARGQDIGGEGGPWDELVGWYWGMWNEIESGTFQESPRPVPEQNISPRSDPSTEDVVSAAPANAELDLQRGGSVELTPLASQKRDVMSVAAGVGDMDAFSPDDIFGLPPKPFRDELVTLFFKHVHPLCPVFDEVAFHAAYYRKGADLAFLQSISLVEFQALIFAGSLHLTHEQVCKTKYSSTIDCHTELFEAARKTYHASSHEPSISLTRSAVLLSYWSPFTSEQQSNSYWIDQAFINARAAILQELDYASISISPGRRRIIWWCCQLRDVLLSFALRRINTLHTEPLTRKMVCADDFGAESTTPCFLGPLSKTLAINNFIRQCELSLVMARIMLFQTNLGYAKFYNRCRHVDVNEIMEVVSFHSEVTAFREDFEFSLDISQKIAVERCDVPCQLSRIISDSTIAVLYFPYTNLDPSNYNLPASKFIEGAIHETMEAASRIARSAETLLENSDSNSIPLALGAWVTFPIVLKLTLLGNTRKPGDSATELQEMRSLMKVLYILKSRFSGGQFVSNVIDAVIKRVIHGNPDSDRRMPLSLLHDAAGYIQEDVDRGIVTTG